jgi:hypothetical protein
VVDTDLEGVSNLSPTLWIQRIEGEKGGEAHRRLGFPARVLLELTMAMVPVIFGE